MVLDVVDPHLSVPCVVSCKEGCLNFADSQRGFIVVNVAAAYTER